MVQQMLTVSFSILLFRRVLSVSMIINQRNGGTHTAVELLKQAINAVFLVKE